MPKDDLLSLFAGDPGLVDATLSLLSSEEEMQARELYFGGEEDVPREQLALKVFENLLANFKASDPSHTEQDFVATIKSLFETSTGEYGTPGPSPEDQAILQAPETGPVRSGLPALPPESATGRPSGLAYTSVRRIPGQEGVLEQVQREKADAVADVVGATLFNVVDSMSLGTLDLLGALTARAFGGENLWDKLREKTELTVFGKKIRFGEGGIGRGDTLAGDIAQVGGQIAGFIPGIVTAPARLGIKAATKVAGKAATKAAAKAGAKALPSMKTAAKLLDEAKALGGGARAEKLIGQARAHVTEAIGDKELSKSVINRLLVNRGMMGEGLEARRVSAQLGKTVDEGRRSFLKATAGLASERDVLNLVSAYREAEVLSAGGNLARLVTAPGRAGIKVMDSLAKVSPAKILFSQASPTVSRGINRITQKFAKGVNPEDIFHATIDGAITSKKFATGIKLRGLEIGSGPAGDAVRAAGNNALQAIRAGGKKLASNVDKATATAAFKESAHTAAHQSLAREFAKRGLSLEDGLVVDQYRKLTGVLDDIIDTAYKQAAGQSWMKTFLGHGLTGALPLAQRMAAREGGALATDPRFYKLLENSFSHLVNMVGMGAMHRLSSGYAFPEVWNHSGDNLSDIERIQGAMKFWFAGSVEDASFETMAKEGVIHDLWLGAAFSMFPIAVEKGLKSIGKAAGRDWTRSGGSLRELMKHQLRLGGAEAVSEELDKVSLNVWRDVMKLKDGKRVSKYLFPSGSDKHLDRLFKNPDQARVIATRYLEELEASTEGLENLIPIKPFTRGQILAAFPLTGRPNEEVRSLILDSLKTSYKSLLKAKQGTRGADLGIELANIGFGGLATGFFTQPEGFAKALRGDMGDEDMKGFVQHMIFSTLAAKHPYTALGQSELVARYSDRSAPLSGPAQRELLRRQVAAKLQHLGHYEADYRDPPRTVFQSVEALGKKTEPAVVKRIAESAQKAIIDPERIKEAGTWLETPPEVQRDLDYIHQMMLKYEDYVGGIREFFGEVGEGEDYFNNPLYLSKLKIARQEMINELVSQGHMGPEENLVPGRPGKRYPLDRAMAETDRKFYRVFKNALQEAVIELGPIFADFPGRKIRKIHITGPSADEAKFVDRFNEMVDILADGDVHDQFGNRADPFMRPLELPSAEVAAPVEGGAEKVPLEAKIRLMKIADATVSNFAKKMSIAITGHDVVEDGGLDLGWFRNRYNKIVSGPIHEAVREVMFRVDIDGMTEFWLGNASRWLPETQAAVGVETIVGMMDADPDKVFGHMETRGGRSVFWARRPDFSDGAIKSPRQRRMIHGLYRLLEAAGKIQISNTDRVSGSEMLRLFSKNVAFSRAFPGVDPREITLEKGIETILTESGIPIWHRSMTDAYVERIMGQRRSSLSIFEKQVIGEIQKVGIAEDELMPTYNESTLLVRSDVGNLLAVPVISPEGMKARDFGEQFAAKVQQMVKERGTLGMQDWLDLQKQMKDEGYGSDILPFTPEQMETYWQVGERLIQSGVLAGWAHEPHKSPTGAPRRMTFNRTEAESFANEQLNRLGDTLDWVRSYGEIDYMQAYGRLASGVWGQAKIFASTGDKGADLAVKQLQKQLSRMGIFDSETGKFRRITSSQRAYAWRLLEQSIVPGKYIDVTRKGRRIVDLRIKNVQGLNEMIQKLTEMNDSLDIANARTEEMIARAAERIESIYNDYPEQKKNETSLKLWQNLGIVKHHQAHVETLGRLRQLDTAWSTGSTPTGQNVRQALLDGLEGARIALGSRYSESVKRVEEMSDRQAMAMLAAVVNQNTTKVIQFYPEGYTMVNESTGMPTGLPMTATLGEITADIGNLGGKPVAYEMEKSTLRGYDTPQESQGKVDFQRIADFIEAEISGMSRQERNKFIKEAADGKLSYAVETRSLEGMRGQRNYHYEKLAPSVDVPEPSTGRLLMVAKPVNQELAKRMLDGLRRQTAGIDQDRFKLGAFGRFISDAKSMITSLEESLASGSSNPYRDWLGKGGTEGKFRELMKYSYYASALNENAKALGEIMSSGKDLTSEFLARFKLAATTSDKSKPIRSLRPHQVKDLLELSLAEMGKTVSDIPWLVERKGRLYVRGATINTEYTKRETGVISEADGLELTDNVALDLMGMMMGYTPPAGGHGNMKARWFDRSSSGTYANKVFMVHDELAAPILRNNKLMFLGTVDGIKIATGDKVKLRERNFIFAEGKEEPDPLSRIANGEADKLRISEDGIVEIPLDAFMFQNIVGEHPSAARAIQEGSLQTTEFNSGLYRSAYEEQSARLGSLINTVLNSRTQEDVEVARQFLIKNLDVLQDEINPFILSQLSAVDAYMKLGGDLANPHQYGVRNKLADVVKSFAITDHLAKGRTSAGFRAPLSYDFTRSLETGELIAPAYVRSTRINVGDATIGVTLTPEMADQFNLNRWYKSKEKYNHFNEPSTGARRAQSNYAITKLSEAHEVLGEALRLRMSDLPAEFDLEGLTPLHAALFQNPKLNVPLLADNLKWIIGNERLSREEALQKSGELATKMRGPTSWETIRGEIQSIWEMFNEARGGTTTTVGQLQDAIDRLVGGFDYEGGGNKGSLVNAGLLVAGHRNPKTTLNDTMPMILRGFLGEQYGNQFKANSLDMMSIAKADWDKDDFDFAFENNDQIIGEMLRIRGITGGAGEPAERQRTTFNPDAGDGTLERDPYYLHSQRLKSAKRSIGIMMNRVGAAGLLMSKMPTWTYRDLNGNTVIIRPKQEFADAADPIMEIQSRKPGLMRWIEDTQNRMIDSQKNPEEIAADTLDRNGFFSARIMDELFEVVVNGNVEKVFAGDVANPDVLPVVAGAPNAVKFFQGAMQPYYELRNLFARMHEEGRSYNMNDIMGRAMKGSYMLGQGDPAKEAEAYTAMARYHIFINVDPDLGASMRVERYHGGVKNVIERLTLDIAGMDRDMSLDGLRAKFPSKEMELFADWVKLQEFITTQGSLSDFLSKLGRDAKKFFGEGTIPDMRINQLMEKYTLRHRPGYFDDSLNQADYEATRRDLQKALEIEDATSGARPSQKVSLTNYQKQKYWENARDAIALETARYIAAGRSGQPVDIAARRRHASQILERRARSFRSGNIDQWMAEVPIYVRDYMALWGREDPLGAALDLLRPKGRNSYAIFNGKPMQIYDQVQHDILGVLLTQTSPYQSSDGEATLARSLARIMASTGAVADAIMSGDANALGKAKYSYLESLNEANRWAVRDLGMRFPSGRSRQLARETTARLINVQEMRAGARAEDPEEPQSLPDPILPNRMLRDPAGIENFSERRLGDLEGRDTLHAYALGLRRTGAWRSPLASLVNLGTGEQISISEGTYRARGLMREIDIEAQQRFIEENQGDVQARRDREMTWDQYQRKMLRYVRGHELNLMRDIARGLDSAELVDNVRVFREKYEADYARKIRDINNRGCP